MSKKKKNAVLDYVNAVKKAYREREIAEHGKLISTRPTKIKKSKKAYNRKENKKIRSSECGTSDFFCNINTAGIRNHQHRRHPHSVCHRLLLVRHPCNALPGRQYIQ